MVLAFFISSLNAAANKKLSAEIVSAVSLAILLNAGVICARLFNDRRKKRSTRIIAPSLNLTTAEWASELSEVSVLSNSDKAIPRAYKAVPSWSWYLSLLIIERLLRPDLHSGFNFGALRKAAVSGGRYFFSSELRTSFSRPCRVSSDPAALPDLRAMLLRYLPRAILPLRNNLHLPHLEIHCICSN